MARLFTKWGALFWGLSLLSALSGAQQEPSAFFKQNCISCHTIGGGRLVGPDLKNVTSRKDRGWLVQFLQNPKAMMDSGDAYALKLQQDARGVIMPAIPGMTAAQAQAVLDMIAAESKLPRSQFAGMQVSERPFTSQDVANGRAIFLGEKALAGGGPACVSCHTLRGLGGLGGGRLGPDLTRVYERLQGRKPLSAWLAAPVSPTMAPVLKSRPLQSDEILALVALFQDSAQKGGEDESPSMLTFFLLGTGGMVLGLVGLNAAFRNRFRGVRRSLVHKNERGES